MKRARFAYLLLIPMSFLLMGARSVPLVDPDPIAVPPGLTAGAVSKAIRSSITQLGWVVSKDEKGEVDAVLNLRTHTARIAIAYDTKTVKPTYVSSVNLLYKEDKGKRFIHRNYLNWMHNVVTGISSALQAAKIEN